MSKTILGMNHVGVAVPSIAAHLESHRVLYASFEVGRLIENETQRVREVFLRDGARVIELLEPLDDASPLAGFLRRNRHGGPIHIAYDVSDIVRAIRDVEDAGGRLISGPAPDVAFEQRRIAFVYLAGQVSELIETASPGA